MKKICIVTPDFSGGGAEKIAVNLANYYVSLAGYEVLIIALKDSGDYKKLITEKVKIIIVNPVGGLSAVKKVKKILNEENPDSIISVIRSVNIVVGVSCFFKKAPRIVFREANTMHAVKMLPFLKRIKQTFLMRISYLRADSVIANSKDTLDDLVKKRIVKKNKCIVIGNPVLEEGYEKSITSQVNHEWLHRQDLKVLVTAGRLHYQKNFGFLIRAFAKAQTAIPQLRLIILGQGELLTELKSLAECLGVDEHIDFLGFVDNPLGYMAKSDLFVLSSRWEGFGNVLVEAMVSGVPIVSTKCQGGPKEILKNGALGKLVEVDNLEAFVDAIIDSVSFPAKETDVEKRINHAKQYEVTNVMQYYSEVIEA